MDDNTKAQCAVCLKDGGYSVRPGAQQHDFFAPLTTGGLPYLDRMGKVWRWHVDRLPLSGTLALTRCFGSLRSSLLVLLLSWMLLCALPQPIHAQFSLEVNIYREVPSAPSFELQQVGCTYLFSTQHAICIDRHARCLDPSTSIRFGCPCLVALHCWCAW